MFSYFIVFPVTYLQGLYFLWAKWCGAPGRKRSKGAPRARERWRRLLNLFLCINVHVNVPEVLERFKFSCNVNLQRLPWAPQKAYNIWQQFDNTLQRASLLSEFRIVVIILEDWTVKNPLRFWFKLLKKLKNCLSN